MLRSLFGIIWGMEMPDYRIGRIVFGSAAAISAAYDHFKVQPIDETRLAANRESPFPEHRQTLRGNAPVMAGVEHQARLAKLQADWKAGAQDEQNESEVR